MNASKAYAERDHRLFNERVVDYYLGKNTHPHDYNIRIDEWDTTQP